MINRFYFKFDLSNIFKKNNLFKIITSYYNSSNFLFYSLGRSCLYHVLKKEITGRKNEVILSPVTLPVIIKIIKLSGAKIKYIDIDILTGLPELNELKKKINSKTAIILITHLYSNKKTLNKISNIIKKYKEIKIIEDLAINFGVKFSNKQITNLNSNYSFFSFNYMKNFHTILGGALYVKFKKDFDYLKIRNNKLKKLNNIILLKSFIKFTIINIFFNNFFYKYMSSFFIKKIELNKSNSLKKVIYPGFYNKKITENHLNCKFNDLGNFFFPKEKSYIKRDVKLRIKKSNIYFNHLNKNTNLILFNPKNIESINLEFLIIVKKDFKKLYAYLLDKKIYLRRHWYKNNNTKMKHSNYLSDNALLLPTHYKITKTDILYVSNVINSFYDKL